MGLEEDRRAGAVRINPDDIVAKPGDLTPNIQLLSEAFNKGFVTGNQIHDRFSAKTIAQDEAATAAAKLSTLESKEVGPLAIQARKAELDPKRVGMEQEVHLGELDEKLFKLDQLKKGRKQRDKIMQAKMGQALDQITQHITAPDVADLNNQFPQLGARFDDDGRVINGDEVRARMPDILAYQKFLDASSDLTKQFENREVELPNGQKGFQTFWKNTNRPVPPAIVSAAIGAKEARFGAGFSETGTIPEPGQFEGAQTAAGGVPAVIAEVDKTTPRADGSFTPGTVTESGVFVSGAPTNQVGKPTEIQAKANKFFRRMSEAEAQYTELLSTGYDAASPKNVALRDLLAFSSKIPVFGPALAATGIFPKATFNMDQIVKNFTSAILRDESGAAIRDDERAEYERMFFPVGGEPPEVSANKARQRASASAALKQVAEGTMSDEQYERHIEQITGRMFPLATSVRGKGATSDAAAGAGPIIGNKTVRTPASSAEIIRVKPGDPIPDKAEWVWFEGEASPRRRRRKTPTPTPALTPAPAGPPAITPIAPAPSNPPAITPIAPAPSNPPAITPIAPAPVSNLRDVPLSLPPEMLIRPNAPFQLKVPSGGGIRG
jgi:hypothetical protein